MKNILRLIAFAIVMLMYGGLAWGQVYIMGSSRATDTNKVPAYISIFAKNVRLTQYASSDTNKVLGINAAGDLVLRTKGGAASPPNLQSVLTAGDSSSVGKVVLTDYVNPNAQIQARAKLSDIVLKKEKDFVDTASGISLLVSPLYNVGAISPSFQLNGAEISPMYKLDGSTNVRGWSLQLNRYYDSASSGHILNHTMLSTGGNFGVNERLERYCGVEIHVPPVYDTADYIYGLRVSSFDAPNFKNSAALAFGPISQVYAGKHTIYVSQYITKPHHLGKVATYIGLATDTPLDDTSKLQFTTGKASGLLKYLTDLSSTYDDRTVVDKGYVDAEIAAIPVIDTTSLSNRIDERVEYTDTATMLLGYMRLRNVAGLSIQDNTTFSSTGYMLAIGSGSTVSHSSSQFRNLLILGSVSPTGSAAAHGIALNRVINTTSTGIQTGMLLNDVVTAGTYYAIRIGATGTYRAISQENVNANNVFLGKVQAGSATATSGNEQLQVTGAASVSGNVIFTGLSEYADNAAAISAGLVTGQLYRTGDALKIVH